MRPSANATPQRPPRSAEPRGWAWLMVLLVASLVIVTVLLVSARLLGSPVTWPAVRTLLSGNQASAATSNVIGPADRLLLADEFTRRGGLLPDNQETTAGILHVAPDRGLYQLQVAPGGLAWSTVGAESLRDFNAEASLTLASSTPYASGGFVARYQDQANFYLFAIDGQGRFQVQLLKAGTLQAVTPWNTEATIRPAGHANQLSLIDDGEVLRLFVNGLLLFEERQPQLPAGDVGVFGAGTDGDGAEVEIDWLRLYALPVDYHP